jgi:nucleoid DNA-binding protein
MINVKDIAHDVARDTKGDKSAIEGVLVSAFGVILERVAAGEEVHIHKFGSFKSSLFKGRTLNSPLMTGGKVTFGDQYVLRFHQAPVAKRRINELIALAGGAPKQASPKAKKPKPAAAPPEFSAKAKKSKAKVAKTPKAKKAA